MYELRIDETVFNWNSSLALQVTRVYIPGLTNAQPGSSKYERELQSALPRTWPPQGVGTSIEG